jgi:hypothetical protein
MTQRTRTSPILKKAQTRNVAIQSIDPNFDIGNGISVVEFSASIEDTITKVNRYNLALSTLTQLKNEMMASEKALANHHERVLSSISGKFGRNSTEYEMAGGRKRATKIKTKATPAAGEMTLAQPPGMGGVTLPTSPVQQSTTESRAMNAVMN